VFDAVFDQLDVAAQKLIANTLKALKEIVPNREELIAAAVQSTLFTGITQENKDLKRRVDILQDKVIQLSDEIGRLQAPHRSLLPWILVVILGLLTIAMARSLWARRT